MSEISIYLFWISIGVLFYCYVGYAFGVFVFNKTKRLFRSSPKSVSLSGWPAITLIVCAYNEKEIIQKKIENILALDYPSEKLSVIFVTDGTTDGSEQYILVHSSFTLLHQPERTGKFTAMKKGMQNVKTSLVVFSDANTMLNKESLKNIVSHYKNEKVGGVAGEKRIYRDQKISAVGEAEGFYWKYESFMKKLDADLNTVVGAAGELFSIRTDLYDPPGGDIILDDFIISMNVCLKGYKIEYEPGAYATEYPSASLQQEMKRKIRISAGAYQSIRYLKGSLNFFKHPVLTFQYVSRRLLRWVVCPLMLPVLFISNLIIFRDGINFGFYAWIFLGQVTFYLLAIPGWWLVSKGKRSGIAVVPFYFVFMNYCLVAGFFRFLSKSQSALWEKSVRQKVE